VKSRISGRYALAIALVLVLGVPAFAVAQSGTALLGGKRNPSGGREFRAETQIIAQNGTYGTRQSNLTDGDGGGAIYGCRSNPGAEPCIRANNLKTGRAFEFETAGTAEAGSIEVANANAAPFVTNGRGTVQNLSADSLDGRDSASFASTADLLFASVPAAGNTATGRGATSASKTGDVTTITWNRDVNACSFTATAVGDPQALSVEPGPANNQVRVTEAAAAPAVGFHIQVVC
jgi:hypothetical protein